MKILFQGGPIDGYQFESDTYDHFRPPKYLDGAVTTEEPKHPPGRSYNDYHDEQHRQFRYERTYYIMDAGALLRGIIYRWVKNA